MAPEVPYRRLVEALGGGVVLARWRELFDRSPLSMPGQVDPDQVAPLVSGLIEGLRMALPAVRPDGSVVPGDLSPGSMSMRDLEKSASFLGAAMVAPGRTGFEAAAALLALRDAVTAHARASERDDLARVFDWLHTVALDAFATARARGAEEKMREMLEQTTPVVLLAPTVPAAFLVGAPESTALDTIFSRLLLLVVRSGASVAIVDATGLVAPAEPGVLQALERFAEHRKIAGKVLIVGAGLAREHERAWAGTVASAGAEFTAESHVMVAVRSALERAGYELRQRPAP